MFFAGSGFGALMATHPPLEKRIKAIEPSWNGEMLKGKADVVRAEEFSGAMRFSGSLESEGDEARLDGLGDSKRLDSQVGAKIREDLRAGRVTAFSKVEAKALLLGLLVAADEDGRITAERILHSLGLGTEAITQAVAWSVDLEGYTSAKKLALVDLSLSWLRRMGQGEAEEFVAASRALIEADGEVNLFEFMLQKVIERHVCVGLGLRRVPGIRYRRLADLEGHMARLLGAFGSLSGGEGALKRAALAYQENTGRKLPMAKANLGEVAVALLAMDAATPLVKQQILKLCALVAMDDGVVGENELELLRAAAEAIGAPVPPLVRNVMA